MTETPDAGGKAWPPASDTSVAHQARIYDYLLGGKDNISQVLWGLPYSGRTATIQALH